MVGGWGGFCTVRSGSEEVEQVPSFGHQMSLGRRTGLGLGPYTDEGNRAGDTWHYLKQYDLSDNLPYPNNVKSRDLVKPITKAQLWFANNCANKCTNVLNRKWKYFSITLCPLGLNWYKTSERHPKEYVDQIAISQHASTPQLFHKSWKADTR